MLRFVLIGVTAMDLKKIGKALIAVIGAVIAIGEALK